MNNFVTIKIFTYPQELAIIRGRLESEGIESRLQDELTIQVDPFYSNALGGVKLQVRESDYDNALEILRDGGYLKDEILRPSKFYKQIDKATEGIPLIGKLRIEFRVLILVGIFVSITLGIIYYTTLPSIGEKLTKNRWCVDHIVYADKDYQPRSLASLKIVVRGACEETLDFRDNGIINMPGFNSQPVVGNWFLRNKFLEITQADTFGFLYNAVYSINFGRNDLVLKSANTTIYCHIENLGMNF